MVIENLEPPERKVYDFLCEHGQKPLSKIMNHTKLDFPELFNALKGLKDKRYVKMTAGKDGIPYYSAVPLEEIE